MKKISVIFLFVQITCFGQIEKYFENFKNEDSPGVIAKVYKKANEVGNVQFGYADIEKKVTINDRQLFLMEDLSKQVTGIAIYLLYKEKLIDFNQSIRKFFPKLDHLYDSVKIKHLITHSSGFYHSNKVEQLDFSITNITAYLNKHVEQAQKPGANFYYQEIDYFLLGCIIEKASKSRIDKYIKKKIFNPLGINNYFVVVKNKWPKSNLAIGMKRNSDNKYQRTIPSDYKIIKGNSYIFMSPRDYAIIANEYYNEKLLSQADVKFMLNFKPKGIKINKYRFGWFIDVNNWISYSYTGGINSGYSCSSLFIPHQELFVLIFSNRMGLSHMRKTCFKMVHHYTNLRFTIK